MLKYGGLNEEPQTLITTSANSPILLPAINREPPTLLSLPTEIKAIIMGMLLAQDLEYKTRTKAETKSKSLTFGRSLNVCFQVNKELSELAAVEIFKTLPISKIKHNTFRFIVTRKRCQLFKIIDFNVECDSKSTDEEAFELLAILPSLPNISEISFKEVPTWLLPHELMFGKDTFGLAANNVIKLEIKGGSILNYDTVLQVLETFIQVKTISLHCDEFTNDLKKAILALKWLDNFSITADSIEEELDTTIYDTSITTISLHLKTWTLEALSWIQQVPRLSHLSLDSRSSFAGTLPPLNLVNLINLTIRSNFSIPLLSTSSLFTSPIKSLTISKRSIKGYNSQDFLNISSSLKKLANVTICKTRGDRIMSVGMHTRLLNWSRKQHFQLILASQERMRNIRIPGEDRGINYIPTDAEEVDLIAPEILTTLDYARTSMIRYKGSGDLRRTKELADVLLQLRDLYIRDEKD